MKDAETMKVPGILLRPEHMRPINRYRIDKATLDLYGLTPEYQERIYRSLFSHSVGFHQLVNELLLHVREGRELLRSNIWKVYQILLESACKTDYQLITQQLEQNNMKEVNALHEKMDGMTKHIVEQEDKLLHAQRDLRVKQNEIDLQRSTLEEEKMRIFGEYHKMQKKLEEEIERRLFFEQKLNTLHSINMTHESNNNILKEKYDKLVLKDSKLYADH